MTHGTYESITVNSFLRKFYHFNDRGAVALSWKQGLALACLLETNEY